MAPKQSQPSKIQTEKSLNEIGYDPQQTDNWKSIRQPRKSDLMKLIKQKLVNFDQTNVRIEINNEYFHCHMLVLQCYSKYFQDKTNESVIVLPADKVTSKAFIMVYEWMLSDLPTVQHKRFLELYNAAEFLDIPDLSEQCWACLDNVHQFTEDRAFMLYLSSKQYSEIKLLKSIMFPRIKKFFLPLVASSEFLQLELDELCTLLQSSSICVHRETEVFMAAVRWLNHDWDNRKAFLMDVINCVRFLIMSAVEIVWLKMDSNYPDCKEICRITENEGVKQKLDDALKLSVLKGHNSEQYIKSMEMLNFNDISSASPYRQWIENDEALCSSYKCSNKNIIDYYSFQEYLMMIRDIGPTYWTTMKIIQAKNTFESDLDDELQVKGSTPMFVLHKKSFTTVESKDSIDQTTSSRDQKNHKTKNRSMSSSSSSSSSAMCSSFDKIYENKITTNRMEHAKSTNYLRRARNETPIKSNNKTLETDIANKKPVDKCSETVDAILENEIGNFDYGKYFEIISPYIRSNHDDAHGRFCDAKSRSIYRSEKDVVEFSSICRKHRKCRGDK